MSEETTVEDVLSGEIDDATMASLLDGNMADDINEALEADPEEDVVEEPEEEPEQESSTEDEPKDEPEEEDPEILTKDGKHTIPFSELEDARGALADANKRADEWKALADANKTPEKVEEPKEEVKPELPDGFKDMLADYPEAKDALLGIMESNATLSEKLDKLSEIQDKASSATVANTEYNVLKDAHSDFQEVMKDQKFFDWVNGQNPLVFEAYKNIYENGKAEQVAQLITNYKDSIPAKEEAKEEAKADPKVDVAKKIKEAEEKGSMPNSLSDVPDSTEHKNEGEVLESSSPTALMDRMNGMDVDQIEDLLGKVL